LAAATAASTSSGPPFGTVSTSSSVAGLTTGISSPDFAPTYSSFTMICAMLTLILPRLGMAARRRAAAALHCVTEARTGRLA
jgi:hypothetical protein